MWGKSRGKSNFTQLGETVSKLRDSDGLITGQEVGHSHDHFQMDCSQKPIKLLKIQNFIGAHSTDMPSVTGPTNLKALICPPGCNSTTFRRALISESHVSNYGSELTPQEGWSPWAGQLASAFHQLPRKVSCISRKNPQYLFQAFSRTFAHISSSCSLSLSIPPPPPPPATQGPGGSCTGCKGHRCMWLSQRKHGLVPGCLEGLGRPRARALLPVLWGAWPLGDQHEEKKVAVCERVCVAEQNHSTVWLKVTLGNTHM